jgi:hypothetical protein
MVPPMSDPDDAIDRVVDALRGRGGRSALYVWMWDNYAELVQARREARAARRRTDWSDAARVMNERLKAAGGGKITAETMRRTWANVVKNAEAVGWGGVRRDPDPKPTERAAVRPAASAIFSSTPASNLLQPDPDDDGFELRAVRPKQS